MKIESTIKRAKGTFVTMQDGTRYAFAPNDEDAHVADVEDDAHIERFLSITEGFRIYRDPAKAKPAKANPIKADPIKADAPDPNMPDATDPDGDDEGDDDTPGDSTQDLPLDQMTLTDLQAVYQRELDRKAHPRAGLAKLIEDIEAHRAGVALTPE